MPTVSNALKEEALYEISRQWKPINTEQAELLRDNITIQEFSNNEIIYSKSVLPESLFYLIRGKVKMYKGGPGKNSIVRVIKPVTPFGYRAFFAGEEYQTAAVSLGDAVVAEIPYDVVVEIMRKNYQFCLFFIKHLSALLGSSDNRTVTLTQKHVRGRLADTLVYLKDYYGTEDNGRTLSVYLSREELADLSNMTTSNAIRTLSAFASEELVKIDGRKIELLNEAKLRHVSEIG